MEAFYLQRVQGFTKMCVCYWIHLLLILILVIKITSKCIQYIEIFLITSNYKLANAYKL